MTKKHRDSGPVGTCIGCGKMCFTSRKTAKKYVTDAFPNQGMSVYRCEEDIRYFHFGHTPYMVARGIKARGQTTPRRKRS